MRIASLLFAVALVAPASAAAAEPTALPTIRLAAGSHQITAEVAATEAALARGLMFRERLAPNHGMLFVFGAAAVHCMWMRNTLIPLSVAFIADDGRIVNIEDMEPLTLTSHCAARPVRLALEMERGWFAKRGIAPGARITGLPAAR